MITRILYVLALLAALTAPVLAGEEGRPTQAAGVEPASVVVTESMAGSARKMSMIEPVAEVIDGSFADNQFEQPDPVAFELWWHRYESSLATASNSSAARESSR